MEKATGLIPSVANEGGVRAYRKRTPIKIKLERENTDDDD